MSSTIWRVRLPITICAALAVTACAHAPQDRTFKGPTEEPVGVTTAHPAPIAEAESAPVDEPSSIIQADSPAVSNHPQYADLFDRIRGGFKIDDVERAAVAQQLSWYARNPEYLERAFGRAELYLYHIVKEIEARGMPLELALLPVVESAFEPFAYSRARAAGLW